MKALNVVILSGSLCFSVAALAAAPAGRPAGAGMRGPAMSTTTAPRGPARTGQPNASCEEAGTTPGHAASAPGSAFNPDGQAGTVYAGEQPQNSRNTASVSQYDVACTHQR